MCLAYVVEGGNPQLCFRSRPCRIQEEGRVNIRHARNLSINGCSVLVPQICKEVSFQLEGQLSIAVGQCHGSGMELADRDS